MCIVQKVTTDVTWAKISESQKTNTQSMVYDPPNN